MTSATSPPTEHEQILLTLSPLELQQRLLTLQADAQKRELSLEEIREGITLTRILRRTNTGPAAAKAPRSKKAAPLDLNSLLD